MTKKSLPTPEQLRELLACDLDSGKLFWKARPEDLFKTPQSAKTWNTRYAGREAFTARNKYGYRVGAIYGNGYFAHRVLWAMANGSWPELEIDHINGDRDDNRISNLRESSRDENCRNMSRWRAGSLRGAAQDPATGRWVAKICVSMRQIYLGRFDSEKDAHAAYREAAKKYHGEFARFD